MTECPKCHKDFKNLAVHNRFCKGEQPAEAKQEDRYAPGLKGFTNQYIDEKKALASKILPKKEPSNEDKPKSRIVINIYIAVFLVYIIIAVAQWYMLGYFKIFWLFYVVVYIIDLVTMCAIWFTIWMHRKKQEFVRFDTMEDFIKQVPRWSTSDKAPNTGIIGSILNAGKQYKQLVLVSETFEPKILWVEWDGFLFKTKDRAYKPPRDVRGDQFFYHIDKKMPLIDVGGATQEDAEESYHENAIANQYFALGHATALAEAQKMIQLMFFIVIGIFIALVISSFILYNSIDGTHKDVSAMYSLVTNMSQRMP